jgi:hypothetical protein
MVDMIYILREYWPVKYLAALQDISELLKKVRQCSLVNLDLKKSGRTQCN